ncbi:MAG: prolipoprotein diacylglyceryl transferase [Holdemanella sp.]|nr:prolipoprotein diacylglyceryl transferase [Holdemanella sp.]
MELFPEPGIFIQIGPIAIAWYSLCILIGILCGYFKAQKTMKKWSYSESVIDELALPLVFFGVIGARIYYVLFNWDYYSVHFGEIFKIWNGGLAIHGGILVSIPICYLYFKRKKISFLRMMDVLFPSLLLAQGIGRWGNFFNQEAYGPIVSENFFNGFPAFIKNGMFIDGAYRMPTFLWESACDLVGFIFILYVFRRWFYRKHGDCGFFYLFYYGITRMVIEGLRTDSLMAGNLKVAQIVSICFIIIGLIGYFGIHIYKKPVILFDLDGTIQDSQHLVFETFRRVFKERLPEYDLKDEELYTFFGPTLEDTFKRYFPEDEVESVIETYQKINLAIHDEMLEPMPHAKEMLEELKEQGFLMAIVSNKRIGVVLKGLNHLNLNPYFDAVLGKEDLPRPKPYPDGLIAACNRLNVGRDNCIYVGDNKADVIAAKNMAAYSIGYSNDEVQLDNLRKQKPCRVIEDLYELVDICKEERSWSDNSIW